MRIYGIINSYKGSGTNTRVQNLMRRRKNSAIHTANNPAMPMDLSTLADKTNSAGSSTGSTAVTAVYDEISTTTNNITSHAKKLLATGKNNLFDDKNSSKAVKEIKNLVSDYNSLITQMQKSGSKTYEAFVKEFKEVAHSFKAELEGAGITCKADGTLSIDSDKLGSTPLSDLEKLFQSNGNFCAKIDEKTTTVNKRAALDKVISSFSGYTRKRNYSARV